MMTPIETSLRAQARILLAAGAALLLTAAAHADGDEGRRGSRVPLHPKYAAECSACHIAYPPGMLPAASWQRVMSGLDKHYGTDASLEPETVKALSAWLGDHAGSGSAPAEDRITQTRWFVREHDEIPAATWKRASIKSASNCAACHQDAAKGNFSEHSVRIPR
jgi:Dihaem cytochrome c